MRNQSVDELEEYNQSLIRICECQNEENCESHSCGRIRQIIHHTKTCKIKVKRNCTVCFQLIKICFYHAKHCQSAVCIIPLCSRMKQTIMEQRLKERLNQAKLRRSRLIEMMRYPPDPRASKRPPGSW